MTGICGAEPDLNRAFCVKRFLFAQKVHRKPAPGPERWYIISCLFLDFFYNSVDYSWVMQVFELLSFELNHFQVVVLFDLIPALVNVFPFIVILVHVMYSNSAFNFACGDNRVVYMVAIHALAAKLGKERRMDIYNSSGIFDNQFFWDQPKKPCQYDQVDVQVFQKIYN